MFYNFTHRSWSCCWFAVLVISHCKICFPVALGVRASPTRRSLMVEQACVYSERWTCGKAMKNEKTTTWESLKWCFWWLVKDHLSHQLYTRRHKIYIRVTFSLLTYEPSYALPLTLSIYYFGADCNLIICISIIPGEDLWRGNSKITPTYSWNIPHTFKHLFMKKILLYLYLWGILGYVPGICWILLKET